MTSYNEDDILKNSALMIAYYAAFIFFFFIQHANTLNTVRAVERGHRTEEVVTKTIDSSYDRIMLLEKCPFLAILT